MKMNTFPTQIQPLFSAALLVSQKKQKTINFQLAFLYALNIPPQRFVQGASAIMSHKLD